MTALFALLVFAGWLTALISLIPIWRLVRLICIRLQRLSQRPFLAEAVVFAAAFLIGAIPWLAGRFPPPFIHDETAYLLGADTFARGRLTNRTPDHWEHFEMIQVLMRPTYQSKFPPGQSLALALGMMLGSAAIGAFGAHALASAGVVWMARAAMPGRWATLAGLAVAVHPTLFWWGQSYWGANVAMFAGAVYGGAMLRVMRSPLRARAWHGFVLGAGAGMLAITRPFEGLLACAITGSWLLVRTARSGAMAHVVARVAVPAAAALAPFLTWNLYYNYRVTGGALRLPYAEHASQYTRSPLFYWQKPNARGHSPNHRIQSFHQENEYNEYARQVASVGGFIDGIRDKLVSTAVQTFMPLPMGLPFVVVPVLGLAGALRQRAARFSLATCVVFTTLHFCATPFLRMQYFAPVAGFLVIVAMLSARSLSRWRVRRLHVGAALGLASFMMVATACGLVIRDELRNTAQFGTARANIVSFLEELGGKHLVFVAYSRGPQELYEWVHNSAEFESQTILWAHSIDEAGDRALRQRYRDRLTWLLAIDNQTITRWGRYEP